MDRPRRSRASSRAQTEAAILHAGREQLAERGAAALSLREVARSVGMVSSAVYRYVDSRDALLTLLLVDAYDSLAAEVGADMERAGTPADRLQTMALGMRRWALQNPEQWGLVYGAPVPGYDAPQGSTAEAGTRLMGLLLSVAEQGNPPPRSASPEYGAWLRAGAEQLGVTVTTAQASAAVEAWCALVGTISMELFGQLGPQVRSHPLGEEILRGQVASLALRLGL